MCFVSSDCLREVTEVPIFLLLKRTGGIEVVLGVFPGRWSHWSQRNQPGCVEIQLKNWTFLIVESPIFRVAGENSGWGGDGCFHFSGVVLGLGDDGVLGQVSKGRGSGRGGVRW